MASDPRSPPPLKVPGYFDNVSLDPSVKASQVARDMLDKMAIEKEREVKKRMYDNLLDAFKFGADDPWIKPLPVEQPTLGQSIREKIDEHKRMIAALEWFAAHVSLDDPKDNALVGRVVLEGLRALSEKNGR